MHIDLDSDEIILNVRLNGKDYELKEPTFEQIEKFDKLVKKDSDSLKPVADLMNELGLPLSSDELKRLGVFKIRKLMDGLKDGLEGKK